MVKLLKNFNGLDFISRFYKIVVKFKKNLFIMKSLINLDKMTNHKKDLNLK